MIDTWLEAFDNDDVTAVVMVDLSAAFDVVDHLILLQKLEIYGFEMQDEILPYRKKTTSLCGWSAVRYS